MPLRQRLELYDEMARLGRVDFKVFYLQRMAYGRQWKDETIEGHDHELVPNVRIRRQLYLNPTLLARYLRYDPDVMIMTGYYAPAMQMLMYLETARRRPWVFWAEMPHVRFADHPIIGHDGLRRRLRELAMWPLRAGLPAEIWAIGRAAQAVYTDISQGHVPVRNVPYYQDLDRFHAVADAREPSPRVRFLFCGSLTTRKGVDVLAESIGALAADGLDFEVHVAGTGPLEQQLDALPIAARQRIVKHGFLQLDDVPTAYAGADVLLYPSRHDGWGMGVIEGLAAGMPVISTAQTGAAVDALTGDCGRVLEAPVAGPLAEAMRWFIDHPDAIEAQRAGARAVAEGYGHRRGAQVFFDGIERVWRRRDGPDVGGWA